MGCEGRVPGLAWPPPHSPCSLSDCQVVASFSPNCGILWAFCAKAATGSAAGLACFSGSTQYSQKPGGIKLLHPKSQTDPAPCAFFFNSKRLHPESDKAGALVQFSKACREKRHEECLISELRGHSPPARSPSPVGRELPGPAMPQVSGLAHRCHPQVL